MAGDVIDLARVRRQKKDAGDGWWEDEGVTVSVHRDPDEPQFAVVRTETSDLIIECPLTREEARALGSLLLRIASAQ